jgi:putative RecB family exonuclease
MVAPEPPAIRRSVSQLTSYAQCGEQFRISRIAKAPSRPAFWFIQGHASHAGIEAYENSGRQMSTAEAVEVYYTSFDTERDAQLLRWPDWDAWMTGGRKGGEQDGEDRRVIGAYQVEEYIKYAEENAERFRVIASEVEFNLVIGGVDVVGYLDQVRQHADGSIEVADLKGGTSTPGSAFQLATYGIAAEEYLGVKPSLACFVKLARPATARAKAKPTTELPHDLSLWPREMIERMFREFDKAERQGIYLPNPTEDCHRTCGVADFCTVPGKGFPDNAIKFAHIRKREDYFAAQQKEVAA